MNDKSINKLVLFYDEYVEFSWSKDFQLNFWKIKLDEIVKKITEEELQLFSLDSRPLSLSQASLCTSSLAFTTHISLQDSPPITNELSNLYQPVL